VADNPDGQWHRGEVVSDDALAGRPTGTTFLVSPLDVSQVEAGAAPMTVNNWDVFHGSLLAVGFKYGDAVVVTGTAVMIGMGLALSARHVFDDHLEALEKGAAVPVCFGVRPDGAADIWQVYALSWDDKGAGDLQLLCLRLVSDLPADRHFRTLRLTTRIPPPGETLTVVGYRFDEPASAQSVEDPAVLAGHMYVSKGSAAEWRYPIHDLVLAPYPTIEVLSGSLGGMSGGAVFDVNGHVVGITSRGWQTEDQQGPTLAAWWMTGVFWRTAPTWPPGVYDAAAILWNMPTVNIVGREKVQLLDEPDFRYLN
jgi:hypothetical protein